MPNRIFQPERYGMVRCPKCNAKGYVLNPKRETCPQCGGFGFAKKEKEKGSEPSRL